LKRVLKKYRINRVAKYLIITALVDWVEVYKDREVKIIF